MKNTLDDIRNPVLRKQIEDRNIKRFRQVIVDLTKILDRVEKGELDGIWFLRRLSVALLGVTFMTDEKGDYRSVGWVDGEIIMGPPEPKPVSQIVREFNERRLLSTPSADRVDFYDAALEEKARRDGVMLMP